ncbi:MAG: VWA domain-containing protein, partial [Chloroflexota bacterium]|nr:VWA domain-containing protein [Chloroflexota bacterium]
MFEALFAFLFKYRPAVFQKGDLAFGAPGSVMLLLAAAAILGIPAVLTYARVRGRSSRRDRWLLGAFRAAAMLLLLFCLFRPMLLLSAAVPQRNWVGVLIDDTRSMRIADGDSGRARGDFVRHALGGPDSTLLAALAKRFRVRLYRFSSTAESVPDAVALHFASDETRLGDAIERAREDLQSVPVSGLVLVTDGADNSHAVLQDELLSLRARSVPVFTVGVGRERFDHDIELTRVSAAAAVLEGGALDAQVFVRQRGYAGRRVPLVVEDDGAEIARQEIALPADGDVAPVPVRVTMRRAGARTLTFRIPV